MLKQRVLFISGILVAIMYFLGFPNFWRMILLLIIGALICFCAILNYHERKYLDTKIKNLQTKISAPDAQSVLNKEGMENGDGATL